jgi:hypothetical protein
MDTKFPLKNLKGKDHFKVSDAGGRTILKCILKRYGV